MPNLLAHDGQVYLAHPWTGEVQAMPEAEAGQALAAGMRPATSEEVDRARLEEHYGGAGQQALTALGSAASGITLGGSDLLLTQAGLVAPETLRHQREVNPNLATATNIGGSLISMAIPGGPLARLAGFGAKAGTRAAAGTAKALTRAAGREVLESGALPRLVGAVAREGTIGAGFGLGQAASDIAVQELNYEQAASRILSGLAMGTGTGAGLGVLAFGGGALIRKAQKRVGYGVKEMRELRGQHEKLAANLNASRAADATSGVKEASSATLAIEQQLTDVGGKLRTAQQRALGKVATRAVAYGIGVGMDGGITGGLLGMLIAPTLLRDAKLMLRPLGEKVAPLWEKGKAAIREKASPWIQKARAGLETAEGAAASGRAYAQRLADRAEQAAALAETAGFTASASRIRQAVEAGEVKLTAAQTAFKKAFVKQAEQLAKKIPSDRIDQIATMLTVETFGELAEVGVGRGLTGAMLGAEKNSSSLLMGKAILGGAVFGGAEGAAAVYAGYKTGKIYRRMADLVTQKIVPPARLAILDAMTSQEWSDTADEIQHLDPAAVESGILEQLPPEAPQKLAAAMTGQVLQAIQYLQGIHPGPDAPAASAARYMRTVQAVLRPDSVLESFVSGDLTRDQVDAFKAVYPEAHAQLVAVIQAELALAAADGHAPQPRLLRQVAMLVGDQQAQAATARRAAMFQAARRGSEKPGPKPRARPIEGISAASETQAQRLQGTGG